MRKLSNQTDQDYSVEGQHLDTGYNIVYKINYSETNYKGHLWIKDTLLHGAAFLVPQQRTPLLKGQVCWSQWCPL